MRTYAQYLGLNAREFVQELPGAKPEPELPPLPDVAREARTPLISASWFIAVIVVVALVGAGLLLFWNRGDDSPSSVRGDPPNMEAQTPGGQGSDQPDQPDGSGGDVINVESGVVPELRGRQALEALDAIARADLRYFVIEIENDDVDSEVVFQQSPSAGTEVEDGGVVTLVVSR
jgi:hypothetical protein